MSWLNIPQPRKKSAFYLEAEHKQNLESLLAYVQRTQPDATLDHVMEEILTRYVRRKHTDFPVPVELEKVPFHLPEPLTAQIEEVLTDRQQEEEGALMSHLVNHALESFFGASSKLRNAWKKDQKARAKEAKRVPSSSSLKEEDTSSPNAAVPDKTRTQSVSSVHARPHTPSESSSQVYPGVSESPSS